MEFLYTFVLPLKNVDFELSNLYLMVSVVLVQPINDDGLVGEVTAMNQTLRATLLHASYFVKWVTNFMEFLYTFVLPLKNEPLTLNSLISISWNLF
jgi:hypothetical protein